MSTIAGLLALFLTHAPIPAGMTVDQARAESWTATCDVIRRGIRSMGDVACDVAPDLATGAITVWVGIEGQPPGHLPAPGGARIAEALYWVAVASRETSRWERPFLPTRLVLFLGTGDEVVLLAYIPHLRRCVAAILPGPAGGGEIRCLLAEVGQ